jgi:hypothetical protein
MLTAAGMVTTFQAIRLGGEVRRRLGTGSRSPRFVPACDFFPACAKIVSAATTKRRERPSGETVFNQVAIDQPGYSRLRTALEWGTPRGSA